MDTKDNFSQVLSDRQEVVEYLRKQLIGPVSGEEEILSEPPSDRYTAGILYPQDLESDVVTASEEQDQAGNTGASSIFNVQEEQGDDPIYLANQYLPASMGISFFIVDDPSVSITVKAGRYTDIKGNDKDFKRKTFTTENSENHTFSPGTFLPSKKEWRIFDGAAEVVFIWRKGVNGWLVTVSVTNTKRMEKKGRYNPEDCLYQVEISCRPAKQGRIAAYPYVRLLTDDPEEQVMDLIYRHHQAYGVGHGCSVNWAKPQSGKVDWISSEFLPACSIPDISYNLKENFEQLLSLFFLAEGESHKSLLFSELDRFFKAYSDWIEELDKKGRDGEDIPSDLLPYKKQIIDQLYAAAERMAQGITLLKSDKHKELLHAFCLANRAMLMQYIQTRDDMAGRRHRVRQGAVTFPDLKKHCNRTWRPFQLAYQLLTLSSVAFSDDPNRDIVDLIWFPTGGGKTEAYLSVAAFLIFYRRLIHGKRAGGTAILMRYTLRLLTAQQFERASTLLCACELIRRSCPQELGDEDISIGLWVGSETTPNTYQAADDKLKDIREKGISESPFQIDRCPWCGTELIPHGRMAADDLYGFFASPFSFEVKCPSGGCPFHNELPMRVVDDQIYDRPPTLLLATVDKFARIVWVEKAAALFGGGNYRPPELIIQDELHLINGPLGTIAGAYEVAIDALCSRNGVMPKVIASTATIRRAGEQVKGLYNRRLALFPPSGLEAQDSYFAKYDTTQPGRLYIGFMGQGHTGSTTMVRVSAAMLQAPIELKLTGQSKDAFWTLVAYHNSLRELGKTLTFAADDIPARIRVIASDEEKLRDINGDQTEELKSNIPASRLKELLNRLSHKPDEQDSVSFLVCTNMFSVGVDVQRLGLMLVNGQPKSSSEYIQASSRVGRRYPGLILALLSPTKPRDRSHYERFLHFHQALYRYVEPGSVTPFSPPARDRTLHAALIAVIRHGLGLNENSSAASFRSNMKDLDWLVEFFEERVNNVDPEEAQSTQERLRDLIEEWERLAESDNHLFYDQNSRGFRSLIRTTGDTKPGWDTLHSMRNVDKSCIAQIKTRSQNNG